MDKIITMPPTLNINKDAYQFLGKLQYDIYSCEEPSIVLDFTPCTFSHAAFTAYFGALRSLAQKWEKTVNFKTTDGNLQRYFLNSGLYDHITSSTIKHANKNSIPFTQVNLDDDSLVDYIGNILDLAPITLSEKCRDLLFKNIYEIFTNAVEHSNSQFGVFACGHWMPTKKKLVFSVCDTGLGIPRTIKRTNSTFSSNQALLWALKRGNSTKQLSDGVPRGLGLSDLKDFIKLNNGDLNIFTNDIYYNCSTEETTTSLRYDILGTLITLTITADYNHVYILKEERS